MPETRSARTSSSSGATTSAGTTSAPTTSASWATRRPTSTASRREGGLFTDWYGQQSCTAGRAAFITGQSPIRTGLTKVGLPGADLGLQPEDPTFAELLKPHGYMTGQYGKNHLGDRDEFLPTAHGFDEFFGNLYHLNAEEEPENADYPKNPEFKERFGPRGVLQLPGRDRQARIEDTGPLTKKRMETIDDEITDRRPRLHRPRAQGRRSRSSSGGTPPGCTSSPTSSGGHRARPASASTPTAWSSTTRHVGPAPEEARRPRHRRQHDRHVLDRQRRRGHELARRWHDAVPGREEHELGGRLPRAVHDQVAGRDRAGHHLQRPRRARGHDPDDHGRGRRAGHRGEAEGGLHGRGQDLQGPPRRLQPAART